MLCGNGCCGDTLAEVVLIPPFNDGAWRWGVDVRRGYSQTAPNTYRWSRHAKRSYCGAPHNAPNGRRYVLQGERGIFTTSGDLLVLSPSGEPARCIRAEHAATMKRIAFLHQGDALTINCQHKSPHVSRLSYKGLMREVLRDSRLASA